MQGSQGQGIFSPYCLQYCEMSYSSSQSSDPLLFFELWRPICISPSLGTLLPYSRSSSLAWLLIVIGAKFLVTLFIKLVHRYRFQLGAHLTNVQCNEARPSCAGCERHNVRCEYVIPQSRNRRLGPRISKEPSEDGLDDESLSPPYSLVAFDSDETKDRRLLELELFHHYGAVVSQGPFLGTHDGDIREMWRVHVPDLAIKHSHLLNAVLSLSALHLTTVGPDRAEYADVHRRYFNKTVSEQRRVLANINQDNADALCLTSSLISIQAFVLLRRDSSVSNYSLPLHWLRLSAGIKTIFQQAWPFISENGKCMAAAKAAPSLSNAEARIFQEQYRAHFSPLLTRSENHLDQTAYEDAMSFVGYLEKYINGGSGASEVRRLLIGFAAIVPPRFVELLQEMQPQALVILAHYFSLVKAADNVWWMHGAPEREVYGIQSILPQAWQWAMTWPLEKMDFFTTNPNYILETGV